MKNISFSPVETLPFLRQPLVFLAKKYGLQGYCSKKGVNGGVTGRTTIETSTFQSSLTNIWIIKITPLSQARDSGSGYVRICFCLTKPIILWRAHVFLAWYSPWHCFIYIFLDFLAEHVNKYVLIWGYFVFSHALHLLPAVFRNSFGCGERKLITLPSPFWLSLLALLYVKMCLQVSHSLEILCLY